MRTHSYGSRHRQPHQRGRQQSRRKPAKQALDTNKFIKKAEPAESREYTATNRFSDFDLHPELHASITNRGFETPMPIQDQAIPHALEGKDLVGIADTGTGKTAAFLIPLLNKLLNSPDQQVLIITPTRELALQIQEEFRQFSQHMRLRGALCIGGTPMHQQLRDIKRNPHFIIGTPGRLKDLLDRRALQPNRCHSIVLDEVDRMVDMGFIQDITTILGRLPQQRQSLFTTATVPQSVEKIMHSFLRDPVTVTVKTGDTANNIEQDVIRVGGSNKIDKLHDLLTQDALEKVLVFGETKRGVERLARELDQRGIGAASIHGDKTQSQRQKSLARFRNDEARVLVATDVAARGLDITGITHVINYDLPQTYDDYTHRIGRAGRAGQLGYALTFVR